MIGTLRALAATIGKMFAADLWLSAAAVATVVLCGLGLAQRVISAEAAPFLLGGGVLAALAIGVLRGARR